MLRSKVVIARPVNVIQNSANKGSHQWGQIRDAVNGEVLHTGQLGYIKRLAKIRYNSKVAFVK